MQISIEKQYQLYLERISLSEKTMHAEQKKQLRQTFFAAWGQLLLLFRDEISEIADEDEAVDVIQNLLDQVTAYFQTITTSYFNEN